MAAQVISLVQRLRAPPVRDWSAQEMAEFYRVEAALLQAGLALESERGLSDEGDPWFCFCRQDTGEVFIHFARVDGQYIVDGAAFGAPARGRDFGALVRDLIGHHPLSAVRRPQGNVHLHPAALLIALVGAAFFQSGHAKAAEVPGHDAAVAAPAKAEGRRGLMLNVGAAPISTFGELGRTVALDPAEVAAILTGVAIGLRQVTAEAAAPAAPENAPTALQSFMAHAAPAPDSTSAVDGRASSTLSTLSGAETRAALTVVAAFTDLARLKIAAAALASDAASPPPVVEAAPADPALASPPVASAAPSVLAGPELAPPRPVLLVTLAEGPLPQVAAVALAIADGAFAKVDASRVLHVETLPAFLGSLIQRGEIVELTPASTPLPLGGGAPPTGLPASDIGHDSGGHDAPVDTGHAVEPVSPTPPPVVVDAGASDAISTPPPSAGPAPVTPIVIPAPAPIEPPKAIAPVMPSHDPKIDAAILDFITKVPRAAVVVSDHEVVFYDPHIIEVLKPGEVLDSMTWKLGDGSSVSIVGLAADLHAYHGVG